MLLVLCWPFVYTSATSFWEGWGACVWLPFPLCGAICICFSLFFPRVFLLLANARRE